MDEIEMSISKSMSGTSLQPASKVTSAEEATLMQTKEQDAEVYYQTSVLSHQTTATAPKIIVVQNGGNNMVPTHASVSSKTAYHSSASTTPTDLMDVVTSAACVGVY